MTCVFAGVLGCSVVVLCCLLGLLLAFLDLCLVMLFESPVAPSWLGVV